MDVKKIVSRRYCENHVFANFVPDWLKEFSVFVCPVERNRVLKQIVEGMTVHMEVLDLTTVESKASKNFHDVSFTFGCSETFQVCTRFEMGWIFLEIYLHPEIYLSLRKIKVCHGMSWDLPSLEGHGTRWWPWTFRSSFLSALLYGQRKY